MFPTARKSRIRSFSIEKVQARLDVCGRLIRLKEKSVTRRWRPHFYYYGQSWSCVQRQATAATMATAATGKLLSRQKATRLKRRSPEMNF